jgi:ubiquinone/menaquinone biosynthesis C-methylase UbiE
MTITALDQMKQGARAMWAAGDYPAIAQRQLWPVGERVVRSAAVAPGDDVLDVACGTGNAALRAAQAGATVTGVDLTPELLAVGRELAARERVAIEYVEGDAEALPVEDERFDVVLSVFGCMFAPRHGLAAAELARVLRPGGRLCVTAWTPEGTIGELFRSLGAFMPPPPPLAQPPLLWGAEDHVRELFAGTGVELEFARETIAFPRFDTVDEEVEFAITKFGPMVMARRMLPPDRWEALLAEQRRLLETQAPDAEYLVITGRRS